MDQVPATDVDTAVFASGYMIADRYEVVRLLGRGGMGNVYLVKDHEHNLKEVAIKVLHNDQMHDPVQKKRFLREVAVTRSIDHKNIVRTYDVAVKDDIVYFTMEYIDGRTLDDVMNDGIKKSQIASLITQTCEGLQAIHKANVFHRDLKPGNIMMLEDGTIKIADFGIARPEVSNLTAHNEIIGSIYYMAPEIWLGRKLTASIDLYSLGIMLYEICTGTPPFEGDSPGALMRLHLQSAPIPPKELNPSVPQWLDKLVLKLLEKSPLNRPRTAQDVIDYVSKHTGSSVHDSGSFINEFLSHLEQKSLDVTKDSGSGTHETNPTRNAGESRREIASVTCKCFRFVCARLALLALASSVGAIAAYLMSVFAGFLLDDWVLSTRSGLEANGLSVATLLRICVIYAPITILTLAIPGTLVALAGRPVSKIGICLKSLVAFLTVAAFALFISNAYPHLGSGTVRGSDLEKAALETRDQLSATVLLSPAYVQDRRYSADSTSHLPLEKPVALGENAVFSICLILYVSLITRVLPKTARKDSIRTWRTYSLLALYLLILLGVESAFSDFTPESGNFFSPFFGLRFHSALIGPALFNFVSFYMIVSYMRRKDALSDKAPPQKTKLKIRNK